VKEHGAEGMRIRKPFDTRRSSGYPISLGRKPFWLGGRESGELTGEILRGSACRRREGKAA